MSHPCKTIRARTPELGEFDFHIHAGPDLYISGDLERTGMWEPFEIAVFSRLCREGSSVLDIGANIGWYTTLAARLVGTNGHVRAFEPDPLNYAILSMNIASLPCTDAVTAHNMAVGARSETGTMFLSPENMGDHNFFSRHENRQTSTVTVTAIDDLITEGMPLPTLVKSDTQGSEARVIAGARRLFTQGRRPDMILEFWPYGLAGLGDDPATLWAALEEMGYEMFSLVEHDPILHRLDGERLRHLLREKLTVESQDFTNLLCLHPAQGSLARIADLVAAP